MTVTSEVDLVNFDAWSGAKHTKTIILEHNKEEDFNMLIEELYPNGLTETTLNDLLWFEDNFIFESLGIEIED